MSINKQLEIPVKGMDCAGCATTVKSAIASVSGVQSVEVLLGSEKAVIQLDDGTIDPKIIHQAIERAGYTVPTPQQTVEIPIQGMDCAGCATTVRSSIASIHGVQSVEVLLSSEKAVIQLDHNQVELKTIRQAIECAGYQVPDMDEANAVLSANQDFTKAALNLFGLVFGLVLLVVVAGEGLGLFDAVTDRVPPIVGYILVLIAAYPTFKSVVRAAMNRQIISHTLMSVGVVAALMIGQWVTAAIVVLFMRVGDYAERFTTERSRRALKNLTDMAPQTARVERDGQTSTVPISEVKIGDTILVRPGEQIPVDGIVISGQATINQAAITGESMPVETSTDAQVFAATIAQLGSLRIEAQQIGADSTFGRIIRLVEEAEAHRGSVQRMADRFSTYFLPLVATIATLTFLISGDPLSTAAVLVVACSCSFALATPIAMLASIGAAAKSGLLIKGGKYIEALAQADVVLLDKTGTLTLGKPQITDIVALNGISQNEILTLAASVEQDSEHPLAEAVRLAAQTNGIALREIQDFVATPGLGVRARVDDHTIAIGNQRFIGNESLEVVTQLELQGKTAIYIAQDDEIIGVLGAADILRPEIPVAIESLRSQGIQKIVMLTGDNQRVAQAIAQTLDIDFQAELLPEDKIAVVKDYQNRGHQVVMVGDGVNDAPALAQSDVGIAMGVAGSDVALEAAHIAIMREDWTLIPEAFRIAQRTMRIVKMNIGFTAVYNFFGLSLAAVGLLPPIFAAAAQSLPDLGILANSSRLLRYQRTEMTVAVDNHTSIISPITVTSDDCACCATETQSESAIVPIGQIS